MKYPEQYRAISPLAPALNCFKIPFESRTLNVIATNWGAWEHVSVSLETRCPNWREMCHVKDLFWNDNEECIQFHPKKSDYINLHKYCLHIWKPPALISEILEGRINFINEDK